MCHVMKHTLRHTRTLHALESSYVDAVSLSNVQLHRIDGILACFVPGIVYV